MDETKEKLRSDFYAKTDIVPGDKPCSWKDYAEYLEKLSVEKMNEDVLKKYDRLYEKIDNVKEQLEAVLSER